MRKLVTIRKIDKVFKHPGADRLDLCIIGGWQVVTKLGEFKPGDLCCFFEIDSFLPIDSRYSFLKESNYLGRPGYRIKTQRLRKELSQGLALPLSMYNGLSQDYVLGDDVTEALSVIKYDVAQTSGGSNPGNAKGTFPSFIPKTDQERIQNLTSYFDTKTDELFEETLKLDGSSMTCYSKPEPLGFWSKLYAALSGRPTKNYHFGVCSRNQELKESEDSTFWQAAISHGIEKKLPIGYALQGELIGPKIQANHEKVQKLEYYVFDVYDLVEERYLLPNERRSFCADLNIQHVPVVSTMALPLQQELDQLLTSVEGQSMNPGTISEGRVYKHLSQPGVTFKVISNRYLLKSEK